MPTRLTRMILLDILRIFVVALIVLTALILLIAVGRELIRKGLGPLAVLELLPFALPISLQHAVPATALFSVCCVYGRMAADGEVSTVKASGISPLRLLQPAFIFSALLSPAAVLCSDLAVSWGKPGVERVVLTSIEDIAYNILRSHHAYTSDHGFSIHVREVDGKRLISPNVTVRGKGRDKAPLKFTAKEGKLVMDEEKQTLVLSLVDSRIQRGDQMEGDFPGEFEFELPLGRQIDQDDVLNRRASEMPLRYLRRAQLAQKEANHASLGRLAALTGFSILTSRPEAIAGDEAGSVLENLRGSQHRLNKLHTEPWRRWAEGFTCLCFVLVGAPLAMLAKTSDYWTTFGMCFLPTLLVYYPLFLFGLDQAKLGTIPPYGVWLGNFVLLIIGTTLIARVRRY